MTFAVGTYRATELLGVGATAQVWRGEQLTTGEVVAMKVFPAGQLAAVRREAALAAAVDHPHVVTVLDVVADDHRVMLVTRYAAGGDLADLLRRRGRLSAGETLTVLIPLADALATAHERSIVHGDISAANIVFDRAGRPLLADLGASRAAMESGRPVQATPCDAAPELARAGSSSPATDMFSLGSVALACLTGRAAWPADDLRDVVIQAAAGQWPDLPDDGAPPPLVAAVRSLLEHDPGRRPGAATLALDLRSAGRPEPVDLLAGRSAADAESAQSAEWGPPAGSEGRRSRGRHGRVDDEWVAPDEYAGHPRIGQLSGNGEPDARHGGEQPSTLPGAASATVRARALTRVRSDAPPSAPSQSDLSDAGDGRARWGGRARQRRSWRSGRVPRTAALVAASLAVIALAGLLGLRWAGSDRANPVALQPRARSAALSGAERSGPAPAPVHAPAAGSAAGTASRAPATSPAAAATALPTTALPTTVLPTTGLPATAPRATGTQPANGRVTATERAGAPPADWTATVRTLDQARARALVSRNPALLDAVYTPDSAARSADASTIAVLMADGLRLSGAQHDVQSAHPVSGAPTTVLVQDSLPAYDLLDSTGSVVGRTPGRAASGRMMVLVSTPAGYRISEVRRA